MVWIPRLQQLMWSVHILPSHLWCRWFGDLKTASDAAHYLLEEGKEPSKCLSCDEQFKLRFNRRCFGVSRNWRWGRRCCWEQISKTPTRLSPVRGNAAAGRRSGIKWLNAFPWWQQMGSLGLWKWINPPVGPLYHSVSSLPKSSPLFPGLICTKERRALASQLLYYATIKPFKDFVCCFPFRMGSERRYWAGFFLDG